MTVHQLQAAFGLNGEVALVTGGGTGLGYVITDCLASAGARVVIAGRRQSVLNKAAARIGHDVTAMSADITQVGASAALIADIEAGVGPLTILVNTAGIHLKKPAIETTAREFEEVMLVHVSASFMLAREAAKVMLPRRKGSVVFIGSMSSVLGIPEVAAYSAAKASVLGLTRALAVEWGAHGIRVNAIVPGWIDTGMARQAFTSDVRRKEKAISRTPLGHLGEGNDIGWAAVYLNSAAARYITGSALIVDGGAAIGF